MTCVVPKGCNLVRSKNCDEKRCLIFLVRVVVDERYGGRVTTGVLHHEGVADVNKHPDCVSDC